MVEWFDDLKIGMRFKSESKTVSKEEILRFASEFDTQPFHLDDEAAKDTILQGLAASGWHQAAVAMRLPDTRKPLRLASVVRRGRRRVALDAAGAARRHAAPRRRSGGVDPVEEQADRRR